MKHRSRRETEALLARALRQSTPDLFQTVSGPLPPRAEAIRFDPLPRPRRRAAPLWLAAACLTLISGLGGWSWFAQAAIIGIQVNPALELSVNRWERVIGATPLNEDGADLLARVDWKYQELDEVAEDLAEALEQRGYFQNAQAQVLVTGQGGDSDRALRWAGRVAHELEDNELVTVTIREGRVEDLQTAPPTPSSPPSLPPAPTSTVTPAPTPTSAPTSTPSATPAPTPSPIPTPPATSTPPPWVDDDWDDDDEDDDQDDSDDEDWDDDDKKKPGTNNGNGNTGNNGNNGNNGKDKDKDDDDDDRD